MVGVRKLPRDEIITASERAGVYGRRCAARAYKMTMLVYTWVRYVVGITCVHIYHSMSVCARVCLGSNIRMAAISTHVTGISSSLREIMNLKMAALEELRICRVIIAPNADIGTRGTVCVA